MGTVSWVSWHGHGLHRLFGMGMCCSAWAQFHGFLGMGMGCIGCSAWACVAWHWESINDGMYTNEFGYRA